MTTVQMLPKELPLTELVNDFLAQRRIAVVGVSGKREGTANLIFRKLKAAGYDTFPVNPNLDSFEGVPCYPDPASIPDGVDGAVIVTRPGVTEEIVRRCADAGIKRVWMHQSLVPAGTSVSAKAVDFCRERGIAVIAGACPMMFCQPVDFGHRCMRWMLGVSGSLPR